MSLNVQKYTYNDYPWLFSIDSPLFKQKYVRNYSLLIILCLDKTYIRILSIIWLFIVRKYCIIDNIQHAKYVHKYYLSLMLSNEKTFNVQKHSMHKKHSYNYSWLNYFPLYKNTCTNIFLLLDIQLSKQYMINYY